MPRFERPPRNFRERLQRFVLTTRFTALYYLGYPVYLTRLVFGGMTRTLAGWWYNRNFRALLQGMPAVLGVIGVFVVTILSSYGQDKYTLANQYEQQAEQKLKGGQPALAQSSLRKLIALLGDRDDFKFNMAIAQFEKGDKARAMATMATLAPDTSPGLAKAHLWQAEQLLRDQPMTQPKLDAAERHLLRIVKRTDNTKDLNSLYSAKYRLVKIYDGTNRASLAVQYARELTDLVPGQFPDMHLMLAKAYRASNQPQKADFETQRALDGYRKQSEESTLNYEARFNTAVILRDRRDYAGAITALREGELLFGPQPQFAQVFRREIARTYLMWFDTFGGNDASVSLGERLQLLQDAVVSDPANEHAIERLLRLSRLSGEEAKKAEELANLLLVDQRSLPIVHFVKGNLAYSDGKLDLAKFHWEETLKYAKEYAVAANNLAWLLIQVEPQDPKRALELVELAIRREPTFPQFRATRGHILNRLGRHKEAIGELEQGIAGFPNNPQLHRGLADAYEKIGDAGPAKHHRAFADSLEKLQREALIKAGRLPADAAKDKPATNDAPKDKPAPVTPPKDQPKP